MLELTSEVIQKDVSTEQFSELVELQLALVGGGCGTPALE